jgi:hypothetical protein
MILMNDINESSTTKNGGGLILEKRQSKIVFLDGLIPTQVLT